MTQEQKIIRVKMDLLELAKQLSNVSQACKMMGFRNGPLGVKPPSDDLATVIVLPSVVGTRAATSCHQMGAGEPI